MPRKDGTGPEAKGAMTGRGLGECEASVETSRNDCLRLRCRKGLGRRLGAGRGMGVRRNRRIAKSAIKE